MNKDEFLQFHEDFCNRVRETCRKKNEDYTGDTTDAFANFTVVERLGVATTEQGFLTRMTDKLQRISSYVQNGKLLVEDEGVEDTLSDLANYCILFAGYLRSKKNGRTRADTRTVYQGDTAETLGRDLTTGDRLRVQWDAMPTLGYWL